MSLFSDNIKYLRIKSDVSQQTVADAVAIPRPRYAKYEDGKNFPPPETLLALSRYLKMSIDLLLSVDVRKIPLGDLIKLENNRILLPITVDDKGNNRIEVVTEKAKAGYLSGYSDPEYIESLQQISLPFLGSGKHRGFPVEGDSMPPHEEGSIIVGRYVENLGEVQDGKTYILITKNQGMVYKRLNKNKKNALILESDNSFYPNYEVKFSEILEIWEFQCNIGRTDKKEQVTEIESLREILLELKRDISDIKEQTISKA
nr:LexA family transcriptional regulator [uncultured Flavobacterium sp.]